MPGCRPRSCWRSMRPMPSSSTAMITKPARLSSTGLTTSSCCALSRRFMRWPGCGYCPPAIADVLNRVRGPFNVSTPALAAGLAALDDTAALARARAHNDHWQPWFSDQLAALGLPLTPSVGNFVLPRFADEPGSDAEAAFAFLRSRGILTRKMGGYGLPQHLRITIGTGKEMEKVTATLGEFMGTR